MPAKNPERETADAYTHIRLTDVDDAAPANGFEIADAWTS